MPISVQCECGRMLKAREEFAGKRAECPTCGRTLAIPEQNSPSPAAVAMAAALAGAPSGASRSPAAPAASPRPDAPAAGGRRPAAAEPMEIVDFLDPPVARPSSASAPGKKPLSLRIMFEALLDPRSIQWMLMLGGGLLVLGLVIWLVSLGLFKDPKVLAIALGVGSLAILGGGWSVMLKTRYKTAGQALTFLGCVVAPMNLWFYHAQGLITLDQNLWIGGVVCCLIYAATVYVLRDPLFMYAVEGGLTLTALLLLADLHWISDTSFLSLFLAGLGLVSIHFERAFAPGDEGVFTRRRYGLPLFWSGHVQLAAGLVILLGTQAAGWMFHPARHLLDWTWEGNSLSHNSLLAGGIWLAGMYGYLYSDLVVRRIGVYTYVAAFCLLMAEVTFVWGRLQAEGVIAVLAVTALAANLARQQLKDASEKINRAVPPLALGLSALPVVLGLAIHLRATSFVLAQLHLSYATGWLFVGVMLLVALCNRASAYLFRHDEPTTSAVYFFFSAGSLIVAAAGLLRQLDVTNGPTQAAWLMLIPLAYLIAARLWMGHSPERPLVWVSHTATAVILAHVLLASVHLIGESMLHSVKGHWDNLMLGVVFSEAAAFYALAGIFRKRSANVYFAAAAACAALWQFIKYGELLDDAWYTMLYAVLGIGILAISRALGIEAVKTFNSTGEPRISLRGRGLALFQSGNAILAVALLAALFQGLSNLAGQHASWLTLSALMFTTVASYLAIAIVPPGGWRRLYWTSSFTLTGLCFLTIHVLIDLSGWQKLEIFCVVIGLVLIVSGYIGRFRETAADSADTLTLGLWTGSLLVTVPVAIAVCYWRFGQGIIHWQDELALVAFTILMLVTGFSWRVQATTVAGAGTLFLSLLITIGQLAYRPQVATGVYLAAGGALVFAAGVVLSIYRDKLLALPDRITNREGIFQVIGWR